MKAENKTVDRYTAPMTELEAAHRQFVRSAAANTIVLLENDGTLPLSAEEPLALFGEGAAQTVGFAGGTEAPAARPCVSILEGLREVGFPVIFPVCGEAAAEKNAYAAEDDPAKTEAVLCDNHVCRTAVYVLKREENGEPRQAVPGDFLLSAEEKEELNAVCAAYERVILVLNVGGPVDLSFTDEHRFAAILLLRYAGAAAGAALADILCGRQCPSACLAESWPFHLEELPLQEESSAASCGSCPAIAGRRPRWPFGRGLSYTAFSWKTVNCAVEDGFVNIDIEVTNTGDRAGRAVLQLYAAGPQGQPGQGGECRLVDFTKSGLLEPTEDEVCSLTFPVSSLAKWNENKKAEVTSAGIYTLFLGEDAEKMIPLATLTVEEPLAEPSAVILFSAGKDAERPAAGSEEAKDAERPAAGSGEAKDAERPAAGFGEAEDTERPAAEAEEQKPDVLFGKAGELPALTYRAEEKKDGEQDAQPAASPWLAPFLPEAKLIAGQLSDEEKAALLCGRADAEPGEPLHSPVDGLAAASGSSLSDREHICLAAACGPAGLSLASGGMTAIPSPANLAQSFDDNLALCMGIVIGREMQAAGVNLWLGPKLLPHRSALDAAYSSAFSEDPVMSGRMAAAMVRGVQSNHGCAAALRGPETAELSGEPEALLRDDALKAFKIAAESGEPLAITAAAEGNAGSALAVKQYLREKTDFDGLWIAEKTAGKAKEALAAGAEFMLDGEKAEAAALLQAAVPGTPAAAAFENAAARTLAMILKLESRVDTGSEQ